VHDGTDRRRRFLGFPEEEEEWGPAGPIWAEWPTGPDVNWAHTEKK
jgi:hypothetical protein